MKKKIVLTLVLWGASAFDGKTTLDALHRGGHENNPVFGPRPSNARVLGLGITAIAAETWAIWHSQGKMVRAVDTGVALQSVAHVGFAAKNIHVHK
jgi:hypothetical protein